MTQLRAAPAWSRSTPRASVAWVKLWAPLGAITLAIGLQAWIRWIFSPNFTAAPVGPDRISTIRLAVVRGFEISVAALALFFLWRFVVRPLLRERTLTFDGMLVIAGLTTYWMDPLVNYFNFTVAYNAHVINRGSWANFLPGWITPNMEKFPEPFVGISSIWIVWVFGSALVGCAVLRRVKERRPEMTLVGLLWVCFAFWLGVNLVMEGLFVYLFQLWTYPATVRALTIFAGKWYQFPIYEPILIGVFGTAITAMRWCRDDQGRSFMERGVDQLAIGLGARKGVSLLAVVGFLHVGVGMVGYLVPWSFLAMHVDSFAPSPSYLRAGICGQGTDYACPDRLVPLPNRSSLHIGPDDPRLPGSVKARQGWPD